MEAARKQLSSVHKAERQEFRERYEADKTLSAHRGKAHFATQIEAQQAKRQQHLAQLKERHGEADNFADFDRQVREADREHMRAITERKIIEWKKQHKDSGRSGMATHFASAILKTAKQEADRGKPSGKDHDRDRGL